MLGPTTYFLLYSRLSTHPTSVVNIGKGPHLGTNRI